MFKRKKSILLVDDDEELVDALALYLTEKGYKIFAVYTGDDVEWQAVKHAPDIIVLDIMLPRMNGYRVCQRLKRNPKTKAIPVLMLSARSAIADIDQGFEVAADDYLTKPFLPDRLAERIRLLLEGKKNRGASIDGTV